MSYYSTSDIILDKLNNASSRIQAVRVVKFNIIVVCSSARWVEEEEHNSKYFFNLEKTSYS